MNIAIEKEKRSKSKYLPNFKYIKSRIIESRYLYVMFFLPFMYYIIFHYVPMYGITIAFKNFNVVKGIMGSPWVGLKYFNQYFTDPYFWKVVRNTILLSLYHIAWGFPAPIILALLINEIKNQTFKKLSQTITYLPHFISTVVVCGMIVNVLSNSGAVNGALQYFGHSPIQFLTTAGWFRTIYVGSGIWQSVGWGSIIYLAALAGVDTEMYEAAVIDGAGRFKQMIYITLPSITPTITIMLIMALGRIMNVGFEKVLLLYNGSTYETADIIATYVYRQGMESGQFSYATAVGLFQGVIGFIFVIATNKIAKKLSDTSLW